MLEYEDIKRLNIMLLITTKDISGINPFFPIFFTKKLQKISVMEWDCYRRFLPFYVIFNNIITGIFIFLLSEQNAHLFDLIYPVANGLVFLYIIFRLNFGRQIKFIEANSNTTITKAPYIVWLDYMSIGAMFVFTASVGIKFTESQFMYYVFSTVKIFFLGYSFLPLLNYLIYRKYLLRKL